MGRQLSSLGYFQLGYAQLGIGPTVLTAGLRPSVRIEKPAAPALNISKSSTPSVRIENPAPSISITT